MNIIRNIINFIKNLFHKKEERLLTEAEIKTTDIKKTKFLKDIRVDKSTSDSKVKINTPICEGDGLGIQKDIKY